MTREQEYECKRCGEWLEDREYEVCEWCYEDIREEESLLRWEQEREERDA